MRTLFEVIESQPRAIVMHFGGKWGLTDREGSAFANVCKHERLDIAVQAFCGERPRLTEWQRMMEADVAITCVDRSYRFVAEWAPRLGRECGWLRPWSDGLSTRDGAV